MIFSYVKVHNKYVLKYINIQLIVCSYYLKIAKIYKQMRFERNEGRTSRYCTFNKTRQTYFMLEGNTTDQFNKLSV